MARRPAATAARLDQRVIAIGLLLFCGQNAVRWVVRYGLGRDDSYAQLEGRLATALPPGAAIIGRDLLDVYLLPKNAVYTFSVFPDVPTIIVPGEVTDKAIPYVILSDKALLERYAGANAEFYSWVRQNGTPIAQAGGWRANAYAYQIDLGRAAETRFAGDIAVGKPAFASSVERGTGDDFGPRAAFDGRSSTRWSSQEADEQWIYVDLGEQTRVGRVELLWEEAYARGYQLQVSDDAATWTTFFSTDAGQGGFEVAVGPAEGRYVRLLVTRRGTRYGISLWEVLIYP
jgi:hypothetical protein